MGRAPCCDNKSGLKKGPWTPEEDAKLTEYIEVHGPGNWRALPKNAGLERCGKSCRLRWTNYLRPDIKRGRFSFEEEETIIQLHSTLGNKWSAIAASLPGRTDNEIKNFWNTHIKKRLLRNGIDPVTHAPRLNLSSILSSSTNLLNLSTLLNAQTLLNPEMLRLASTILLLKRGNGDLFSPIGTETNTFSNTQNPESVNVGYNFTNFGIPNFTADSNTLFGAGSPSCYINGDQYRCSSDPAVTIPLENNTNFDLPCNDEQQNLIRVDNNNNSVISTPLSNGADLSSSSSPFMNNGTTTEDDRDSYCSDFLRFEIPEGIDFSEFM